MFSAPEPVTTSEQPLLLPFDGVSCVAVKPVISYRPCPLAGLPTSASGTVHVMVAPELEPFAGFWAGNVKYLAGVVPMRHVVLDRNGGEPSRPACMPTKKM